MSLGWEVLEADERGKRPVLLPDPPQSATTPPPPPPPSSRRVLFYMPHCPQRLYSNVLWANWTPQALARLLILGNR